MKSRTLSLLTAAVLLAFLKGPTQTVAQAPTKQPHYKLVDAGTFGGPNSGNNGESPVINRDGHFVGFADTPAPDPFAPNCFGDCFVQHAFEWRNGVLTDLGALHPGFSSYTNSINAYDQIAGFSQDGLVDPLTGTPEFVATVWQNGRVISLGTFGGEFSLATANNNLQQVVGCAGNNIPDSFAPSGVLYGIGFEPRQLRAFRWQGKQLQDLRTLGGSDACAVWVNDLGQITGASFVNSIVDLDTSLPTLAPFLWENGRMLDLGTLGGTVGLAYMVNNRGQVIGQSSLPGSPGACITGFAGMAGCHAFLWDQGVLTDLGTLGGDFSIPNWINDTGEVVGVASNQNEQAVFAFVWKKGVMTNLGTLKGDCFSQAFALNSAGHVVGQSISCDGNTARAVLWERGEIFDLNVFVPPGSELQLTDPKMINDAGKIVLSGILSNGDVHSVLLVPCEEGEEGCVDNVGVPTAAQSTATPDVRGQTVGTLTKLTPIEITARIRALLTKRNRRFGLLPTN